MEKSFEKPVTELTVRRIFTQQIDMIQWKRDNIILLSYLLCYLGESNNNSLVEANISACPMPSWL